MVSRPLLLNITLLLLTILLGGWLLKLQLPQIGSWAELLQPNSSSLELLLVQNYTLPRIAIALLAGTALGLASLLLQQVVNNPLASDNTLAVSSGAQYLLFSCTLFFPSILHFGSTLIAFLGALAALALVFLLAWRKNLSPLIMILAGLVVNLYLGSLSATLMLFYPEESRGLMIWGAGSLLQESWLDSIQLFWLLIPALVILAMLQRPLAILALNDSNAKSLGVPVQWIRFAGLLLSAYLVAIVISRVGMLGFIGLAATTISRQLGIRTFRGQLLQSAYLSAVLLLITDLGLQLISQYHQIQLPTGAVTAVLGTPLLLWLMFKNLPHSGRLQSSADFLSINKMVTHRTGLVLSLLFILTALFALLLGNSADGWTFSALSDTVLELRYPRLLYALAAGIMLSLAGVLLQRLSFNPMASPELLGITSGVSFGVLLVIFGFSQLTQQNLWIAGICGALLVLLIVMLINGRSGMLPERILLTGISLAALFDAIQRILLASGDFRIQQLLSWTSGSTYYAESGLAIGLGLTALLLLAVSLIFSRWLDLLSLQAVVAKALGLNMHQARWIFILLSAVLTACATLVVGPLSFIGLLAPHLAHYLGFHKPKTQILAAALIGATVMITADWLGRQILFPYEIPAGLVATLLGGSYFLLIMRRV
ncbi:Fe(3+)-hydroxamate ABC transporter permease FhuB [Testudinibacter sp. TR-2022]|uniref:Fe(3+)-hydroxamate ABC transporter permease FhuB n=1 Tax=Testudinibacter sp. TR-2022 TaxID=2585029 RepID=UPI00111855C7|nr:Fe(3+)-hydroxamate ABC transporter permease FhuB [Testudinibacter sp. TR-2022]TNH08927.1 Fe(3+)-hydroxamate ABC transporter permease FhuB [Pasteurellaceae bacterium Phil11]TNH23467.1 Fe(3+)-hydroxamate ABC transporter permease FhuB [Testudinibacter sp. TR-2022]TNH28729.1 Fe(3+)-hydroxamate ABC transporter permease FhuB [Testudinibacter sp. TR-2022]